MGGNNSIRGNDGAIINQLWRVATDSEGNDRVVGGVNVLINEHVKRKNDLPIESNTAEAYFKADNNGNIIQLRVYDTITHKAIMDIDFDRHENKKTKEIFPKGVAHVQEFKIKNGIPKRQNQQARLMTDKEISKWGDILLAAIPNLKFR